jgi:hypothetical protein
MERMVMMGSRFPAIKERKEFRVEPEPKGQ